MKITAYYLDGMVEEYNTETHYSTAPLFGSANVGVVSYNLFMDDASKGPLWLQFCYFDSGESLALPVKGKNGYGAQMVEAAYYAILTEELLEKIAFVECDGKRILWRPEPDAPLINGIKFLTQSELLLSGKDNMSLANNAVELYRIYHGYVDDASGEVFDARLPQLPNESDEDWNRRIADYIGWDYATLMRYVSLHKDKKRDEDADDNAAPTVVDPDAFTSGEDILPPDMEDDLEDGFDADPFDESDMI